MSAEGVVLCKKRGTASGAPGSKTARTAGLIPCAADCHSETAIGRGTTARSQPRLRCTTFPKSLSRSEGSNASSPRNEMLRSNVDTTCCSSEGRKGHEPKCSGPPVGHSSQHRGRLAESLRRGGREGIQKIGEPGSIPANSRFRPT